MPAANQNNTNRLLPIIKGYKITRFLASGGMGKVFVAIDLKHKREVAIKVMHAQLSNDENNARFMREASLMKKVRHPNIVKIYGSGQCEDGSLYMVMQLIQGVEIHDLIQKKKVFTPALALFILEQTALGLVHAHKKGITHRDIKPHNLFLDKKSKRVLIVDFGLAKAFDSKDLTRDGDVLGSPSFMSPEQATGQRQTEKSDIYSLGTVLFKLLTGRNMYTGTSAVDVIVQHVKASVPKLPDSLAILQPLLDSMCSKDERDRPSAESVLQIIESLAKNTNIKSLPALSAPVESAQDKEQMIITQILGHTQSVREQQSQVNRPSEQQKKKPVLLKSLLGITTVAVAVGFMFFTSIKPLIITGDHAAAVVYVDGQKLGASPFTATDLSNGEHDITVQKDISETVRFIARRKIKTPLQEDSIRLHMKKEFLVNNKWVDIQKYSEITKLLSADKWLTQAYAALEQDNLFADASSAYFQYIKAVEKGKKDPLFIVALDKKSKENAQSAYKNGGLTTLKIYLADVETAWQHRPWMTALLEQAQAEYESIAKAKHRSALAKANILKQPTTAAKTKTKTKTNVVQRDCPYCPEIVKLAGGTTLLGARADDKDAKSNEQKAQKVHIKSFYMAKNLATVEQFSLFLNAKKVNTANTFTASKAKLSFQDDAWSTKNGAQHLPMAYISYQGAQAYCAWLGEVTGLAYRLPNEQEWEYAARADTKTIYWWGNQAKLGMANVLGVSGADQWNKISPVASFPANAWGLHDMGGNLWQWTTSPSNIKSNPILKGSSWINPLPDTRPSRRSSSAEDSKSSKIGFRCVRN